MCVSDRCGTPAAQVHNEGGAYVGGYWVPIEESHKINIEGGSNEGARMPIRGSNPREDRLGA